MRQSGLGERGAFAVGAASVISPVDFRSASFDVSGERTARAIVQLHRQTGVAKKVMKLVHGGSIRRFITLWLGAVVLSFVLLGGGLLYAVPKLNTKTQHLYNDSRTLDNNHRFELALIEQGRDDLLWHLNRDKQQQQVARHLKEADDALQELRAASDDAEETHLLDQIATAYGALRQVAQNSQHSTPQMQNALDKLLVMVHSHRDLNAEQMQTTLQSGHLWDEIIGRWTTGLLGVSTLLLVVGSLMLWSRVFTPVLKLARAVHAFGGGDLKTRAPIAHDDEMGDLCQTFNVMADSIAERERERLRFVATVAHDLRNPLVIIGGAAHLLKTKDARLSADERALWLSNIEKNSLKIEGMIGDLMDGVQAETGQIHLDQCPLDFAQLVRETIEEHAQSVQTHLIRHDLVTSCFIEGDAKRLERVLMNLLSNAIKYSEGGSEVSVTLMAQNERAICCICDEGAGIAAEDLPKLFLPFSRLERTKKMAPGTGLGLSSVKKIIEGHGGTINVRSTVDVGTTVEIMLPLLKPAVPV